MIAFVPTLPSPANDNFAVRHLTVLSYSQGFTHWHYRGGTVAAVSNPAYFNPAEMLAAGDVLWVSAHDGFVSHYILRTGPGRRPGPDMRSMLIERTGAPLAQAGAVA
jgi:hypothetical protein